MREPYALKGARTVPGRGEGGNTLSLFDVRWNGGFNTPASPAPATFKAGCERAGIRFDGSHDEAYTSQVDALERWIRSKNPRMGGNGGSSGDCTGVSSAL